MNDLGTAYYPSGAALRSRSVGPVLLCGQVAMAAPPARLRADWQRDCRQHLGLEPGDVEALSLPRARTRWPDYRLCVQAVEAWLCTRGLAELLRGCDLALMACRGAPYHHDGAQYGGMAFCNLFLSEDCGLDLHFPALGERLALQRGSVVVFDTCQPHAVIGRRSRGFDVADFAPEPDRHLVFLTWELPIEHAPLARALQVHFDTDPDRAARLPGAQLWVHGAPANLCPESGRWRI